MKDEALGAALRRTLEREALAAPPPGGLLETVQARCRRRRIRYQAAGVSAAALAVAGIVLGTYALPLGNGAGPAELAPATERAMTSPEVSGPGAFAAEEIGLCLTHEGGRLTELTMTWAHDGDRETTTERLDDTSTAVPVYEVRGDSYAVMVEVGPGAVDAVRLDDETPVGVNGRAGVIGTDPVSGERVLAFASGVGDSMVRLAIRGAGPRPGDDRLSAWAEKFSVHDAPGECAS